MKGLAEFAPAGANKNQNIFAGGVYVGKNSAQPASVEFLYRSARKRALEEPYAAASRYFLKRESRTADSFEYL